MYLISFFLLCKTIS